MTTKKIAIVQMNARDDKDANMAKLDRLIRDVCAKESPDYVLTPEYSTHLGGSIEEQHAAAEPIEAGNTTRALASLAKELGIHLHVGSVLERDGADVFNTSIVFDTAGALVGRYRKIHRFDIETPNGFVFRESDVIGAGTEPAIFSCAGMSVGASICYDIRFAELYLSYAKAGVGMITIPAAFNYETGASHWETLIRARAIETQSYVAAAAQIGMHPTPNGERPCFGNSMIVDPWGKVVARCSDTEGWAVAVIDTDYIESVRGRMPVAQHRRLPS